MQCARLSLLVGAMLILTGGASAQYRDDGRVPPRWNHLGSAVCPDNYDFYRGWCRPRTSERVAPEWNSQGSALCPDSYDYYDGWCRPRGYGYRGRVHGRQREYGYDGPEGVPPRWNSRGSAVCPDNYDYYAQTGLCLSRD